MNANSKVAIRCNDRSDFSRCLASALRALPKADGEKLMQILSHYFGMYGMDYAYSRMNERTVEEIFAEFTETLRIPSVSGEVEGVRFELFDPPEGETGLSCPGKAGDSEH